MKHQQMGRSAETLQRFGRSLAALWLATMLSGCVVVGASSRGGLFLWPGGLGLVVMAILLLLLLRRR